MDELKKVSSDKIQFKKFKDSLSPYLNNYTGSYDVANHLFRLVSGLESMIIGEFQIVEQLKEAYYFSKKHKMLGPILSRMIQKSLETGKYIRTNTEIGRGAVSVSYAAVEQITSKYNLSESNFLCVGLGETSKLSIRHLHQKKIKNIKICNRTESKTKDFCNELGYQSVKFKNFKNEIKNSDVVIFSTSSKTPLLNKSDLSKIMTNRKKNLLLVDLSVPRNLASNLEEIDNVEVINVDNLKDAVNENYKKRKAEIIKAELYIEEFLVEFDDWTINGAPFCRTVFGGISATTSVLAALEDDTPRHAMRAVLHGTVFKSSNQSWPREDRELNFFFLQCKSI